MSAEIITKAKDSDNIAEHADGIFHLHAAANATPKDMYAKMGFEIVETVYEYYLEW